MRRFIDIIVEAETSSVFWHGSPSGDLRGAHYGLHLGTQQAAREALESRIGVRADGRDWDGSEEYGKTLLAGRDTYHRLRRFATGFNCGLPCEDFYAGDREYKAKFSSGDEVPLSARPALSPFRLVGPMKNTIKRPSSDVRANNWMTKQIAAGDAPKGCYYRNEGEDEGSISIVVPDASFITPA